MIWVTTQLGAFSVIYIDEQRAAVGAVEGTDRVSHFRHHSDYSLPVTAGNASLERDVCIQVRGRLQSVQRRTHAVPGGCGPFLKPICDGLRARPWTLLVA